jgi:hypothetical protein
MAKGRSRWCALVAVIAGLAWATPAAGQAATGTDDPLGSPSRYSILQAKTCG